MSQLINKRYKDYDRVSRYATFPIYYNVVDDKYLYGLTSHINKESASYVNHKVKNRETLDNIALYYYNNPTYYWIIADFNDIQDPYIELEVGSNLKIPTFSTIKFNV